MSDPWEDEGFGAENDSSEESLEADLEEDDPLAQDEPDPADPSKLADDELDDHEQ